MVHRLGFIIERAGASGGEVEFAEGGDEHGGGSEGVGEGDDREDGQFLVAEDEAGDGEEGEEGEGEGSDGDRGGGVSIAEGDEEPGATAEDDGEEGGQLATEGAAEADHDEHAGDDAEEEEEDGAEANGDTGAGLAIDHAAVDTEHGHEQVEDEEGADDEAEIFGGEPPLPPEVGAKGDGEEDHFFRDVEDAEDFAEDEFGRRDFGDEEEVEGLSVAFVGNGVHSEGVDHDEGDDEEGGEEFGGGWDEFLAERAAAEDGAAIDELLEGGGGEEEEGDVGEPDEENFSAVCPRAHFAPEDWAIPDGTSAAGLPTEDGTLSGGIELIGLVRGGDGLLIIFLAGHAELSGGVPDAEESDGDSGEDGGDTEHDEASGGRDAEWPLVPLA